MDGQMTGYQGEDICFTIMGGDAVDLDSSDFKFIVYPCGNPENNIAISKAQCQKTQTNVYIATIPQTTSKTMIPGIYSIEIYDAAGKAVYQRKNALIVHLTATKEII